MDFSIENFDFVILKTGYTAKIMEKLLTANIIEEIDLYYYDLLSKDKLSEVFHDMDNIEDVCLFLKSIVFIYDESHPDVSFQFLDDMFKIINTVGHKSINGSICLECRSFDTLMNHLNVLFSIHYCTLTGISRMRYVDKDGCKILVVEMDAVEEEEVTN